MTERDPQPNIELLAALDAGLLVGEQEARAREAAASGQRATAVLAALAATKAELAALPEPPVPPDVAAQWDAALAAETGRRSRHERRRRHRWRVVAAAGLAAALAAGLLAGVLWLRPGDRLSLEQVDLVAAARAALGTVDAGGFADPVRRAACLRFVAPAGADPDAPLLAGRQVTYRGEPGVLLVLGTGELGRFHVVVVDEGCGPDGGRLLGSEITGW